MDLKVIKYYLRRRPFAVISVKKDEIAFAISSFLVYLNRFAERRKIYVFFLRCLIENALDRVFVLQ